MRLAIVPWVFTVYGAGCIIGAPIVGRLLDRFHCYVCLYFQIALLVPAYVLLVVSRLYVIEPIFFVVAFLFGLSDAILNTLINAMLMRDLPNFVTGAMSSTLHFLQPNVSRSLNQCCER